MFQKIKEMFIFPKKITIEWSYPKKVDGVLSSPTSKDENWGLYQISTKTESEIKFLYIGKSWNDYHKRLKSHKKSWFDHYEGEKYVRFGSFRTKITEQQLDEIESAVIFQTKLIQNNKSTISYRVSNEYKISSNGNRGEVDALIETLRH